MCQIWGFWKFCGECMERMAWHLVCWCILTTSKNYSILVMVCWFSCFWFKFDLSKWVMFGFPGHFMENAYRYWLGFFCVCWCMQSTSSNDLILVIICSFSYFWPQFDLTKWVIFGVSGHFLENTRMGRNGLKGGVEGHFWRFLSNPVDSVTGFRSFAGTVSSLMPCCFSNNHTGVKRSSVTSTNDFGGAVITPDAFITWLSSSFSAYQNGMHVLVYYDTSVAKVLLRT